jgi:hypothetical protein
MQYADFSLKAVFMNFYAGFLVLAHELYWLFGPGWILQNAIKKKRRQLDALRVRLSAGSDSELAEELAVQEQGLTSLEQTLDQKRAAYLEKMRQRIRTEF